MVSLCNCINVYHAAGLTVGQRFQYMRYYCAAMGVEESKTHKAMTHTNWIKGVLHVCESRNCKVATNSHWVCWGSASKLLVNSWASLSVYSTVDSLSADQTAFLQPFTTINLHCICYTGSIYNNWAMCVSSPSLPLPLSLSLFWVLWTSFAKPSFTFNCLFCKEWRWHNRWVSST